MIEYIDLSHTIIDGMETYRGLDAPHICDFWSREASQQFYADGVSFHIGKIEMVANTGTYLDTPFHRYANGKDLSELPISGLVDLVGIRIQVDGTQIKAIDRSYFENLEITGKAILIQTNWSKFWGTEAYFHNHPYLTKDAAEYLQQKQVALVGIDSYNIDDTADKTRPVHSILLRHDIPIVEHLCNLASIPPRTSFFFSAIPPKIKAFGTFPVRAYAKVSIQTY